MRLAAALIAVGSLCAPSALAQSSDGVQYFGNPSWSISQAVQIPPGHEMFWTSGTIPPAVDTTAASDDPARYGDMETQATGVLTRIEGLLAERGMSMEDVVYIRAYLAPDADGNVDVDGWSAAYGTFFGTEENPTKPARSTIAVYQLVNPAWRIEVEAFAAVPGD